MRKLKARSAAVLLGGLAACAGAQGVQEVAKVTVQGGGCAKTPAAAILLAKGAAKGVPGMLQLSQKDGYRVQSVRWDILQRQSWALVRSCEHPELPAIAMLTDLPPDRIPATPAPLASASLSASIARANAVLAVVKTGDLVRLWKSDSRAHIELIGTAEENGAVGVRIRVRLKARQESDGQTSAPQLIAGVVRGPADVEIEP